MTIDHVDIDEVRAQARAFAAAEPRVMPELPSGTYETAPTGEEAPVSEVMVYRPRSGRALPGIFVNLHGGGFVLGDALVDDPYCRYLADRADVAVVNFEYVLAPEHKFPAAIEQVYALLNWLAGHGEELGLDGTRLAVGGHSAGGNLATAACMLARDRGGPALRGQVLDYPPLDLATAPATKVADVPPPPLAEGQPSEAEMGALFNAWYLASPAQAADPLASPVHAPRLAGLPPALVITAELDPLRAEADRYAERLAEAGVATEHRVFEGCRHGFTHAGPHDEAVEAWDAMASFIARVLS